MTIQPLSDENLPAYKKIGFSADPWLPAFTVVCLLCGSVVRKGFLRQHRSRCLMTNEGTEAAIGTDRSNENLEKWAKKTFAAALTEECPAPDCGAEVGELCNTKMVWVHAERLEQAGMM